MCNQNVMKEEFEIVEAIRAELLMIENDLSLAEDALDEYSMLLTQNIPEFEVGIIALLISEKIGDNIKKIDKIVKGE